MAGRDAAAAPRRSRRPRPRRSRPTPDSVSVRCGRRRRPGGLRSGGDSWARWEGFPAGAQIPFFRAGSIRLLQGSHILALSGGRGGGGFPGNAPAPGADPSHCPGTLRASSGGRAGAAIVHTERRILDSEIEFAQVHLVGRKRKTLGIRKFALAVTNFSFP